MQLPHVTAVYERLGLPTGVLPLQQSGQHEQLAYLVYPYYPQTLADRIEAGPIPAPEVGRLLRSAADAIVSLHLAGLVHGDIKPANFLLSPSGQAVLADLDGTSDFGAQPQRVTPGFCPPEQVLGAPLAFENDVYSFAATVLSMLSGGTAWMADPHGWLAGPLAGGLAPEVTELLAAGIAREPSSRRMSPQQLVAALGPTAAAWPADGGTVIEPELAVPARQVISPSTIRPDEPGHALAAPATTATATLTAEPELDEIAAAAQQVWGFVDLRAVTTRSAGVATAGAAARTGAGGRRALDLASSGHDRLDRARRRPGRAVRRAAALLSPPAANEPRQTADSHETPCQPSAHLVSATADLQLVTPSEMRLQHSRRSTDHGRLHRRFLQLMGRAAYAWDPVAGGQLVLLTNGIVIVLTLPLVDPHQWREHAVLIALATACAWMVSVLIPWRRLPRKATVAFPLFAWAAMAVLGFETHGIAGAWGGLFTLWFAYLGLTHRSGTSLLLLPGAIGAYIALWGGWSSPLLARLLIVTIIWLVLAELLAALIHRHDALTEEMRLLAHVDTLTNLANRRDLDLRLIEAAAGDAVVLLDLDHFKQLNDTLGHSAGDAVLSEFGLMIRATLRTDDYAARYGGEEFALVLPSTSESEAATTLGRIRQRWAILRPEVTFSAGVAVHRHETEVEQTLRAADEALYAAKRQGRNQDHGSQRTISQPVGPRAGVTPRRPRAPRRCQARMAGWPHAARHRGPGLGRPHGDCLPDGQDVSAVRTARRPPRRRNSPCWCRGCPAN